MAAKMAEHPLRNHVNRVLVVDFEYFLEREEACEAGNIDEGGAWERVELYQLLLKAGAKATPDLLKVAAGSGQARMASEIRGIKRKAPSTDDEDDVKYTEFEDGLRIQDWKIPEVDVGRDSEKFRALDVVKRKTLYEEKQQALGKIMGRPHALSGYSDTGEIVLCPQVQHPYRVLLNKTDISYGAFGFYNFYRLELIHRRGSELYVVFTNWGRIGDEGQFQKTPFGKLEEAVKEFRSIFRSKTGNEWDVINTFQPKPKKYHLVERDMREWQRACSITELEISLTSDVPSRLPNEIQTVMADLSNVKALQSNTKCVIRFKHFLMPFGLIRKDTIMKARDVLGEIGTYIKDLNKSLTSVDGKQNHETTLRIRSALSELSNDFYQLIPMSGMENSQLQVIDNVQAYQEYHSLIHNLLEYEIAGEVVTGAAMRREEMAPADYLYSALGRDLITLDPEGSQAQLILHYIHNSCPDVAVKTIFGLTNTNTAFPTMGENRRMLWHGTRTVNLLSILRLGLLPAPPASVHTGTLFGKGVYLADAFAKSDGYSQPSQHDGYKYILLCEVALGEVHCRPNLNFNMDEDSLPKGTQSIKACGSRAPDPLRDLTLPTGAVMPMGELMPQEPPEGQWYHLNYNEYVVYDPSRVAIRYLVQYKG